MNDEDITIEEIETHNTNLQRTFIVTIFEYRVTTTVTRRACVVRKWISKIRYFHRYRQHKLLVGLGVQWRPPMDNKVATLQLCVGCQCLIFQICRANSIPKILTTFLGDDLTTFVGVRNQNDSWLLNRDYKLNVGRVLELSSLTNLRGASMGRLASEVLGYDGIEKPERVGRSDWDRRCLTDNQVLYASIDAHISFMIAKKLCAWK